MTSKIVVNNIEADAGVSTVTFASNISAPTFTGNVNATSGVTTVTQLNVGTDGTVITTTTDGRVGVGTNSPVSYARLHISGSGVVPLFVSTSSLTTDPDRLVHLNQSANDNAASILLTGRTPGGIDTHTLLSSSPDNKFHIYTPGQYQTTGTKALTVNSSGYIGIGTTSPNTTFDVRGDVQLGSNMLGSTKIAKIFSPTHASSNRGARVLFGLDDGSFAGLVVTNTVGSNASFNSQNVSIFNHNGGIRGDIESLTCRYDGNVGIGSTNPTQRLQVGAASTQSVFVDSSGNLFAGDPTLSGTIQGKINVIGAQSNTWSTSDTSNYLYQAYPNELQVVNTQSNTTNSFASILLRAGQTSTDSQINSARIAAIRTAAFTTDLAFAVRSDGNTMSERLRITSDGSFTFTQTPGKYTIDTTNSTGTSIANGGTVDFATMSGMLIINNWTNGNAAILLVAAGGVVTVAQQGTAWGTVTFTSNVYRFTNNTGGTATFAFMCFRTRNNA